MMTETAPRNYRESGDLATPSPLNLEQVRWCPQCRRFRGPTGRFLTFEAVRRLAAARRAEARRVMTERAIAETFGHRVAETRARQTAAILFDTPRPAVPAPRPGVRPGRPGRRRSCSTPMPALPLKPTRADLHSARTARLLFG